MTTILYDISEIFMKKNLMKSSNDSDEVKEGKVINVNFKKDNNKKQKKNIKKSMYSELIEPVSFEDKVTQVTSNAIASLLMSLEEDNVDSEHPLLTYRMVPEVYVIIEKYVTILMKGNKEE